MKGYKRCKCRSDDGKELGAACPKLRRRDSSWNPLHGTWYGKAELSPGPDRQRVILRQGGFATQDALDEWFAAALQLLSVPEHGPDGHGARVEILSLIREARQDKSALPGYDDIRRRYQDGAAFRPGTAGDYLTGWIAKHEEADDWSATTQLSYKSAVRRLFLPAFGDVPLDKLRTSHVLGMLAAIDAENERILAAKASPDPEVRKSVAGVRPAGLSTKRRHLAVLRSALAEAMSPESRLITSNVAAIRIGKGAGKKGRQSGKKAKLWTAERERVWREGYAARVGAGAASESIVKRFALWRNTAARPGPVMIWTPAQLGAFLDAAEDDRLYALFSVIAHCGLRRGEACGVRWEDTDFETGSITIANQIVQVGWKPLQAEPKTESSEATVRVDAGSMAAVKAWRRTQLEERVAWGPAWTDTGLAFTREDGSAWHPAQVTARFERLAFNAGLPPIRLHDLRHGAATLALAGGADIKAVSSMLRHSSIQITADIYADVLPELAAEVASTVASMVPRKGRLSGAV